MKRLILITGVVADAEVFFIREPWTLAVSGNRTWTIEIKKTSDSSVLETFIIPLGAGSWNLAFDGLQRDVEWFYWLTNSATSTTYYEPCQVPERADAGYASTIGVTATAI